MAINKFVFFFLLIATESVFAQFNYGDIGINGTISVARFSNESFSTINNVIEKNNNITTRIEAIPSLEFFISNELSVLFGLGYSFSQSKFTLFNPNFGFQDADQTNTSFLTFFGFSKYSSISKNFYLKFGLSSIFGFGKNSEDSYISSSFLADAKTFELDASASFGFSFILTERLIFSASSNVLTFLYGVQNQEDIDLKIRNSRLTANISNNLGIQFTYFF